MAESPEKSERDTEDRAPAAASTGDRPAQDQQQRTQVQIDDSKAMAAYANFFSVTATPEELIIDLALTPQPFSLPTQPIHINQRIIINFYAAKRLLYALQVAVQRHEAAFGVLETDVQKRIRPGAMAQPPSQSPRPSGNS